MKRHLSIERKKYRYAVLNSLSSSFAVCSVGELDYGNDD